MKLVFVELVFVIAVVDILAFGVMFERVVLVVCPSESHRHILLSTHSGKIQEY